MSTAVTFSSVSDLRDAVAGRRQPDPAWAARMLHKVPDMPTVKDRAAYLVAKAAGKVVLDIGCTGPISTAIRKAAKGYHGIDRVFQPGCYHLDLDRFPHLLPRHDDVEVVICSEFLEHLANPGNMLQILRQLYPTQTFFFTAPNAGAYQVKDGCEVVHEEHVCWYSYATLRALLRRYHFEVHDARWYNGEAFRAEGIIMVAK